jgi:hypothetical protein
LIFSVENVELPSCVAIVIPAYNAEATLATTLDSALAENGVAEIVVVDDGSCDGTLALARGYEPRVRVLTGPNAGVSAARNRGAAETSAPWLLFLDADDLLEPGTIAARLDASKDGVADVIICDWRDLTEDCAGNATLGPRRSINWASLAQGIEVATAVTVWATTAAILYRRTIFDRVGGFRRDLPVIQDARFLFDAAFQGARFAHAPHIGAQYRVLPGSLSRRDPTRFLLDVLLNGEQIEALWRCRGALSPEQAKGLAAIYNQATRGLFASAHPRYFDAVRRQRSLGQPVPVHSQIAAPMARLLGLKTARSLHVLAKRTVTAFAVATRAADEFRLKMGRSN